MEESRSRSRFLGGQSAAQTDSMYIKCICVYNGSHTTIADPAADAADAAAVVVGN